MAEQEQAPEKERRDWVIILIILLFGFLCVILAGGWAIRFAPTWKLDTNMRSNIDPNSDFLTNRPSGYIEPLDPSILTQPAWINVFLTPGALFPTSAPVTSLPTNTPLATNTTLPTIIASPTTIIPTATNTLPYFPPPTNTPKPPLTQVDLQITKTDGMATYIENGSTIYTIIVTNAGPNGVNGVSIVDNFPAQIASANWTCSPSGGATCTANGSGNINQSANMPAGSTVTYTVAATIGSGVSGNLVNTASVSVPSGYNDTNAGNNSATDTDTYQTSADLQITKTDGVVVYEANDVLNYTIIVTNNGPDDVIGATVQDDLTNSNIASANWTCMPSGVGASCATNGLGNINDSTVNIPSGMWVTYNVTVTVSGSPSGNLVNTATVTEPGGIVDPTPGNNSASDTDQIAGGTSSGNIGTGKDSTITTLPAGGSIILTLSSTITIDSHPGPDIVYYEEGNGIGIDMDWVILEVSEGSNWYTVLNWGDGFANPGTNINIPLPSPVPNPTDCGTEIDDCTIDMTLLYNNTGVSIDLDHASLGIPDGLVIKYIRITIPSGGVDSGAGIDGIYVVP